MITNKWIIDDEDNNVYKCPYCDLEWIISEGTPLDNEMNYCPKCGTAMIYEETNNV